jgi:hypothetical protein
MWFIQCSSEVDGVIVIDTTVDIGIPAQTPVKLPPRAGMTHMLSRNTGALAGFLSAARGNRAPIIHYGYILRSRSGAEPDLVLESDMMKTIRAFAYNLPKPSRTAAVPITAQNRTEYIVLRSYLDTSKYTFLGLFPQFAEQYAKYDALFEQLSARILGAMRSRVIRDELRGADGGDDNSKGLASPVDHVAAVMLRKLETDVSQINPLDAHAPGIVMDFLIDATHLELYRSVLLTTRAPAV